MTIKEVLEKLDLISQECHSKADKYIDVANQSDVADTKELYIEWSSAYKTIATDLDSLVISVFK